MVYEPSATLSMTVVDGRGSSARVPREGRMGRRMDDAVATVDSAGLVTALTTGMADIEAKIPLPNRHQLA